MKVYYFNAGSQEDGQCYLTSNYRLEEELNGHGMLVDTPEEADVIYIQENCGGLALFHKFPDKIKIVQLVNSHPNTYCKIYYDELKKYNAEDVRPRQWAPIKKEEMALADYITVYSKYAYQSCIKAGISKKKLKIIPKGVEVEIFKPLQENKLPPFKVGFAGQLQYIKGFQYIPIPEEGDYMLLFAGDKTTYTTKDGTKVWYLDDILKKFERVSKDYGKLTKKEMVKFYNECDVIIQPTLSDAMNMVVLEALACDIPVITTKNCGAGEFITHHKEGSIIPIRDIAAIKEEIKYWKKHKAKGCRQLALKHTMKTYINNIIRFIEECYNEKKKTD